MITVVTNIHQLVTQRGTEPIAGPAADQAQVYEDVTLVIRDDRVAAIERSGPAPKADRIIDAARGIVVPGLVDACVAAQWDGSRRTEGSPPSSGCEEGDAGCQRRLRTGEETLLRHGTTSAQVMASSRADGAALEAVLTDLQQLAHRTALRLSAAFVAAPLDGAGSSKSDRISKWIGETIPTVSRRRLAATCALLCGEAAYSRKEGRALLRAARGAGLALRVQAVGADDEAILLAADLEAVAIDHLAETVDGRRFGPLRQAGTLPVLLPAESALRGSLASMRHVADAGLPLAFGTGADLTEGGVLSMWTVIALAVRTGGLSLFEALTAATLNAAAAIGVSQKVGTLEPGKMADCVILDLDDYRKIPDFIVGLPVRAVLVGGEELSA